MNAVLGKDRAAANVAAAEEAYEPYVAPTNTEASVMNELEDSYLKSRTAAPPVPSELKAQLNALSSPVEEEDDEALSYFQKLANG